MGSRAGNVFDLFDLLVLCLFLRGSSRRERSG